MASAERHAVGVTVSPFATGVILISSSFLLGAFYTHWVVDYNIYWLPSTTSASIAASLAYYATIAHGPHAVLYERVLGGVIGCAALAAAVKVGLNGRGGILFDGASLLLLLSALLTYLTTELSALSFIPSSPTSPSPGMTEALKSLAASNMLIAVALTGVLSLQGGQYFSDKPREDE